MKSGMGSSIIPSMGNTQFTKAELEYTEVAKEILS